MKHYILVVSLFLSMNLYSQDKYIYVSLFSDSLLSINDTVNTIGLFSPKGNLYEEVEPRLFKIPKASKVNKITLKVAGEKYSINFKKYKKNRFLEIHLYVNPKAKVNCLTLKVKKGDLITTFLCSKPECSLALLQFSAVITIGDTIEIIGNEIFKKYIFE